MGLFNNKTKDDLADANRKIISLRAQNEDLKNTIEVKSQEIEGLRMKLRQRNSQGRYLPNRKQTVNG